MNVVIFACVDFPEGPATTSRVRLLSRILHEAGHSVSLAIFNANAKKAIVENKVSEGCFESVSYRYLSGRTVRPEGVWGKITDTVKGIANSVPYLRERKRHGLADVVIFYTPDIFHCLPAFALAKLYRIPTILELCEIFSSDRRTQGIVSRIKRLGACICDRKLPVWSSGILAISTKIIGYLEGIGISDRKIMHLPVLVDHELLCRQPWTPVAGLEDKRFFLNSGALDEKEGLGFILEAFALLTGKYQDIYLVLTGTPEKRREKQVLELAKRLGIGERLVFTGFLSSNQLIWAYHQAAALLCCRAGMEFANYGFPTKLAEYLSSGSPVIANDVGDIPLYLDNGESAFMATTEDAGSIAEQMARVLDNPLLASEVGLNGRNVAARHFDFRNYVIPVDEFLKSVCAKRSQNGTRSLPDLGNQSKN